MKIKISYEGAPFEHVGIHLKTLKNLYANLEIVTQPNIFYLSGENINIDEIQAKCEFLRNAKFETYDEIQGLTYEQCREKITHLVQSFNPINLKEVLHKNACLFINPKALKFHVDFENLPMDVVTSVMNDQLIFVSENSTCIIICEEYSNPQIESIKLILKGRLFDRVLAIKRDLEYFDTEGYVNDTIMSLCNQMNADEFLCKNIYYDLHSRTVSEDLSLLGTVSAIKFHDDRLRQIHKDGQFSHEITVAKCIIHLNNLLTYDLPQGKLDPFGVKKSADFIINCALEQGIRLPELPQDIKNFLNKRLKNKIKETDLMLCREIDWQELHINKNISLNIPDIKRLIKLISRINLKKVIDFTENEIEAINKLNLQNLRVFETEIQQYLWSAKSDDRSQYSEILNVISTERLKELKSHFESEKRNNLTDEEIELSSISHLKYNNINEYLQKYINYIDSNRIAENFFRIQIIRDFLSKINEIIEIK